MEKIDITGVPETIAVRRRFLSETERVKMLAYSAMDETWAEEIGTVNGNALVIVGGAYHVPLGV